MKSVTMSDNPSDPLPATSAPAPAGDAGPRWLAGVRYPSGREIWCALQGGEAAWTPDRRFATGFLSESIASLAARQLSEGDAVPFWVIRED